MSRKHSLSIMFFICAYLLCLNPLAAQEEQGEIIIISERVGKEIDQEERDKFKLFEKIKGFQSALYIRLPDNRYFLKITYLDEKTGEIKISRSQESELSIKTRGDYIDRFEEKQAHQDSIYQEPGTAFFVELMGKPYPSINIDFRINKSSRFSLGIMYYFESKHEDGEDKDVNSFMPNIMYYYLGGKRNKKFEIGGGFGVRPVWHKDINGDFPLAFHGVIGYRYQKKDGLLFRIGFTPSIYPEVFLPFIGISFGYSL